MTKGFTACKITTFSIKPSPKIANHLKKTKETAKKRSFCFADVKTFVTL